MDKNTVYILQKDLPNVNAGAEIKLSRAGTCYNCIDKNGLSASFQRKLIECNPDWFKVKEEPQWEILEFECKTEPHTIFIKGEVNEWIPKGRVYQLGSTTEIMLSCGYYNIRSVKRFPDNTVWSVDMVTEHGIITAFKIVGSTMVAEIKNNVFPYDYPLYLSELKAPKEEQVPIKVHSLHHLGENSNDAATQIVTSHRIPPSKYQSIKSAIEDVLNEDIKFKWHEFRPSPTEQQVNSPLFQAIWSVIKGWDIDTSDEKPRVNYHGANGSDVLLIMDSIKKMKLHTESELLQARRDAFSSGYTRGWHNGCFEEDKTLSKKITDKKFEDYINSLK